MDRPNRKKGKKKFRAIEGSSPGAGKKLRKKDGEGPCTSKKEEGAEKRSKGRKIINANKKKNGQPRQKGTDRSQRQKIPGKRKKEKGLGEVHERRGGKGTTK